MMIESSDESGTRAPSDLIASAIETEKEAALFYNMLADMTSNQEARDTLLVLAKDEASHAVTLANLYFEITGHGITDRTSNRAEGDPNLFDLQSVTRRDALEFALRNEIKAAEHYQSQADATDNRRIANIFRILAETERDHAAYMRLQLSRLDASRAADMRLQLSRLDTSDAN
jgi:rubrerythrin